MKVKTDKLIIMNEEKVNLRPIQDAVRKVDSTINSVADGFFNTRDRVDISLKEYNSLKMIEESYREISKDLIPILINGKIQEINKRYNPVTLETDFYIKISVKERF